MASSEYKVLQQQASSSSEEDVLLSSPSQLHPRSSRARFAGLVLLLFTSLLLNAILLHQQMRAQSEIAVSTASAYGDDASSPDWLKHIDTNDTS